MFYNSFDSEFGFDTVQDSISGSVSFSESGANLRRKQSLNLENAIVRLGVLLNL